MKITVTTHAQLNALVAERVLGLQIEPTLQMAGFLRVWTGTDWAEIPNYSTDLNAAEVLARQWGLRVQFLTQATAVEGKSIEMVVHKSTAIAICIAALRCEGVDVELQLQEGN